MTTTKDSTTEGTRSAGAIPDLRYSEAEEQLRAVVRDLLDDRSPWPAVLARVDAGEADDLPLWHTLAADLGCAGLLIPESHGGAGASYREAAVVAEETGRAAACVPYLTSAVMATAALLGTGDGELLGGLASGRLTAALAAGFGSLPPAPDDGGSGEGRGGGRRAAEPRGQRGGEPPGRQPAEQVAVTGAQQGGGGHHGAGQVREAGGGAPGLLGDDRGLAVAGAGPAVALRDQQAGAAQVGGQGVPERDVVGLAGVYPGQHGRPGAPVFEQVADDGPELLLGLAVAQIGHGAGGPGALGAAVLRGGHRGRSFQGTRVSVRGSAGSPSTRSAMMFRRISEVPPSMEFPRARRYR